MIVNRFQISSDMTELYVDLTADQGLIINTFKISTEETYNDSQIDLSSKLAQVDENESIVLVPTDLGITSFSGIYIAEFTSIVDVDTTQIVTAAACNTSQFYYCVNEKLTSVNGDCINCDENMQNVLLIDLYLEGLKTALILERYTDAIVNYYSLNRLCSGSVDACVSGCTSGYGILDGAFALL